MRNINLPSQYLLINRPPLITMAGKKAAGENTKKAAGNAKKAEAAAQKAAVENTKKAAVEDAEWGKGAKSNAKK